MLFLRNVKELYNGTAPNESAIAFGVDIVIDAGVIKNVYPHRHEESIGDSHTVVDASRFTVTPGLIDCHSHITALGMSSTAVDIMNGQTHLLWVEKILYSTLVDAGVTTIRDLGGATHQMKRLVEEGTIIGPRLKIAISMLSTTGGHADMRGFDRCHATISRLWPEVPGRPSCIVDGPWECRKRVREIAACGADLIKICTSPGVASASSRFEGRDFMPAEIEAICDEAAARGLKVAAHAHSHRGITLAILNGVKDIQHISFMDERLVEEAHKHGCIVTPTSWILHAVRDSGVLSPSAEERVKLILDAHTKAVTFAARGGLRMLAGTDPVVAGMHGRNYRELVYLIQDGVSPLSAWWGMTGLAATEVDQPDSGTIIPGQRADFLVCEGDVLNDPKLFDKGALIEVFKDGVAYRGGLPQVPPRTFSTNLREALGAR